jgi:hypothetical protein
MSFLKGLNNSPQAMEKIEKLLKSSVGAIQLLKDAQKSSPEDREKMKEEFLAAQKEISAQYEGMLAEMGMTRESLEEYAANPKNFSPESWEFLQSFKSEMTKQAPPVEAKKEEPAKKLKKNKLGGRKEWLTA